MVKRKLGRGLGSLLENALDETGKVIELDISKIHPNPWQPRRQFDFESLENLAASIKEKGLIQPITVRYRDKDGDFEYELVTGERRLRAADLAGLKTVPAIVSAYDDRSMAEVALIENLQREDLNPIEECEAYQQLMNDYGLTQEQMAAKVGKSRPYIANMLRLADFPDEVKKLMVEGKLTTGQARPLLGLSSGEEQVRLAKQIVDEGLSARHVEDLTREKKKKKKEIADPQTHAFLRSIEEKLGMSVGSRVAIKLGRGKNAHSGTISITFKNDEEFERITEFLNGKR